MGNTRQFSGNRNTSVLTGQGPITKKQKPHHHRFPMLQGVLPLTSSQIPSEIVAGATLAALAIPEVMGYTRIAGTPVVTGLYTLLLPMALFALFGSSRHLVVGADSATAAILAGGLVGIATPNSPEWLALSGAVAILVGVLLLIARVVRLGFLADFLSRTVLVGFLTGVGIQVAAGEIPGLLGLRASGHGTIGKLASAVKDAGHVEPSVMLVAAAVIVLTVGARFVSPRVPGALIAVIGCVAASWIFDLQRHGVPILGAVPSGMPSLGIPNVRWSMKLIEELLSTATAATIVILAQSAATSRAYASRNGETFSENVDLVGLALANLGAAFSGTFLVNGSPTKTEMVASAGGRTQFAQLVTSFLVLIVLLFLTRPLSYMPQAVLSAVVFLIGVDLINVREMRRIWKVRPIEFWVATITAAIVVLVGVEQGILAAMVLSLLAHVRRGYRPRNTVLVAGRSEPRSEPVSTNGELRPGLLVYGFNHSMYYANAEQLSREVTDLVRDAHPNLRWFCFDMAAVDDVDYSAAQILRSLIGMLRQNNARPVLLEVMRNVEQELDRYGILHMLGDGAIYREVGDVIRAYEPHAETAGNVREEGIHEGSAET